MACNRDIFTFTLREAMDWTPLAQDTFQWWALVNLKSWKEKKKLTEQIGVAVTFVTGMRGVIGSNPGQSAICPDGINAFDVTTRSFQIFSNSSFIVHSFSSHSTLHKPDTDSVLM
jgi:hypothetical protein